MLTPSDIWAIWSERYFATDTPVTERRAAWFGWHRPFDRYVRKRLLSYALLASEDGLNHWEGQAEGALAMCLLLDRVARKCLKGTCLHYEYDKKARRIAHCAFDRHLDHQLSVRQTCFLAFPLIASDRIGDVSRACAELEKTRRHASLASASADMGLLDDLIILAERNRLVLQRYRRYPHRAQALGFGLSTEEQAFVRRYTWQDWI